MKRVAAVLTSFILVAFVLVNFAFAQKQPRVFVTDSQSWQLGGGGPVTPTGAGSEVSGGARPQTAEIIKTFNQRCPNVIINNKRDKADYVVVLDHEGGKTAVLRDNKIAVFNRDGDAIMSKSTRSLGNAVQEACTAIYRDWPRRASAPPAADEPGGGETAEDGAASSAAPEFNTTRVQVTSEPTGADITIDGNFVGSTPSAVDLNAGDHVVVVEKKGYQRWERRMKTTAGTVTVAASLEKTN